LRVRGDKTPHAVFGSSSCREWSATRRDAEALNWASWNVGDLAGKKAQIRIVDDNTGGWGHLNVEHIVLSDTQAARVSQETSVNLLVDGKVVRSATSADSETLDWASFDMRPYEGKKAQIQVVDMNTGGWGHVMADQFTAADKPAKSVVQRADWADYGKDYYAAVSWENAPGGKRYMIGWMNNWDYGQSIPTSPWRSAQSVPREMALRTVDGQIRLTSKPVGTLESLRQKRPATASGITVKSTSKPLTAVKGKALDIEATFSLKDAERFGLKVRTGAGGEETVIGYDTTTQELYVDRTRSGAGDFNSTFPGVQTAPLKPKNGKVKLRILVDWSSVEVFGGNGEAVITDSWGPSGDDAPRSVRRSARSGFRRAGSRRGGWQGDGVSSLGELVTVLAGLLADQGVDTPATADPEVDVRVPQHSKDGQHIVGRHHLTHVSGDHVGGRVDLGQGGVDAARDHDEPRPRLMPGTAP